MTVLLPHHIENVSNALCFAIEISLYRFCTAFRGASFEKQIKILSFTEVEIYAKEKSRRNISNIVGK